MDNMLIFNKCRAVPKEAQKTIKGGRLNGMTDINPMWRISVLTETFGPCGIGWKYAITRRETIPGANGEISCFVDIDLYYKLDGEWSEAVPGTGGAAYVAKEKNGLYTSDECYKMALTDALSVACKALGIGADIYWAAGRSKYTGAPEPEQPKADPKPAAKKPEPIICECCGNEIQDTTVDGKTYSGAVIAARAVTKYGVPLCYGCLTDFNQRAKEDQAEDPNAQPG